MNGELVHKSNFCNIFMEICLDVWFICSLKKDAIKDLVGRMLVERLKWWNVQVFYDYRIWWSDGFDWGLKLRRVHCVEVFFNLGIPALVGWFQRYRDRLKNLRWGQWLSGQDFRWGLLKPSGQWDGWTQFFSIQRNTSIGLALLTGMASVYTIGIACFPILWHRILSWL